MLFSSVRVVTESSTTSTRRDLCARSSRPLAKSRCAPALAPAKSSPAFRIGATRPSASTVAPLMLRTAAQVVAESARHELLLVAGCGSTMNAALRAELASTTAISRSRWADEACEPQVLAEPEDRHRLAFELERVALVDE